MIYVNEDNNTFQHLETIVILVVTLLNMLPINT